LLRRNSPSSNLDHELDEGHGNLFMTYLNHKNKNKGLFSLENRQKIKIHDD
jgi:hypothetical protein